MPGDGRLIALKQHCHLVQREPDGIIHQVDFYLCQAVSSLVKEDFTGIVLVRHNHFASGWSRTYEVTKKFLLLPEKQYPYRSDFQKGTAAKG